MYNSELSASTEALRVGNTTQMGATNCEPAPDQLLLKHPDPLVSSEGWPPEEISVAKSFKRALWPVHLFVGWFAAHLLLLYSCGWIVYGPRTELTYWPSAALNCIMGTRPAPPSFADMWTRGKLRLQLPPSTFTEVICRHICQRRQCAC